MFLIFTQTKQEKLVEQIRGFASESRQSQQLAMRMKQLMPQRLAQGKSEHRSELLSVSEATRKSLLDPEFIDYIDQYCDITHKALVARVQYETHLMLYQMRQSLCYRVSSNR